MTNRLVARTLVAALTGLIALHPGPVDAASAGKAFGKAATARLWKIDRQNHAKTPAKPLAKPRTVHRYTSAANAKREARHGLAPNTHMTARAPRGRPPAAATAQHRYGLPRTPQVRETIRIEEGFPVRHNRAVGGARSYGELTSPKPLPPSAILKITPVR